MIMEILSNFIFQILFSVGVIVVFGLIIALCRRAFCHIVGENSTKIIIATGAIGTPIHELSHAIMCIIFGHKIVEMKLYQPNSEDGTLGYVSHTYNPKNLYHQVGNFFIGVAPIIGGSAILLLLMSLLTPNVYNAVSIELEFASLISADLFDASTYEYFFDIFWAIIKEIFWFGNLSDWKWWIFIILAIMVAMHMEVSTADIKGGAGGFAFIAVILLVADIILWFVSPEILDSVTSTMMSISAPVSGFLAISAVFSGIMIMLALIIKGGLKIFKK
jgi:hypothetical protein